MYFIRVKLIKFMYRLSHQSKFLHLFFFIDLHLGNQSQIVTVPPIGPDELPPPYTPSSHGGGPLINCKVCQSLINIEGKTHQHVVKCNVCNEATVSSTR